MEKEDIKEIIREVVFESHQAVAKTVSSFGAVIKSTKDRFSLSMVIQICILVGGLIASYYVNVNAQDSKAATIKADLTQQISTETLERTTNDTALSGRYDIINSKLDALMTGLNIHYSLPKSVSQKNL